MLRVTVSPSSMLSRSTQARVSACASNGANIRDSSIASSAPAGTGSRRAGHGRVFIGLMCSGSMRSALLRAAAQVFVAEACAQQRAGVVGHAPAPGGVGALTLFGGGLLGRCLRLLAVFGFTATLARGRGIEGALHGLALGGVGGLLAGPGLGVDGVRRRIGVVVLRAGRVRRRRAGSIGVRLVAGIVVGFALALLAAFALLGPGLTALAPFGRRVAGAPAPRRRRLTLHGGFDRGAIGHRIGHARRFGQGLVIGGQRLLVAT